MGDLTGILSSVLSGGVTGVVGLGMQMLDAKNKRNHDLLVLREQNENAKQLRQMDIDNAAKLAAISADSAETLATIDAESRAMAAASADLQASYSNDRATYFQPGQGKFASVLMAAVDMFRGTIRPATTVYGLVLLTILMMWVMDLYSQKLLTLTPEDAKSLAGQIIDAALFIPSLTVTCWFGSRYIAKSGGKT